MIGEKEKEDAAAETKREEVGARVNCSVLQMRTALRGGRYYLSRLSISSLTLLESFLLLTMMMTGTAK